MSIPHNQEKNERCLVCGAHRCAHWRNAQTERLRREIGWARAAMTADGQPIALSRQDVEHLLQYIDSALAVAARLSQ